VCAPLYKVNIDTALRTEIYQSIYKIRSPPGIWKNGVSVQRAGDQTRAGRRLWVGGKEGEVRALEMWAASGRGACPIGLQHI
jgi:hypothetical protein